MCFDDDARPPLPPIRGGAIDARDVRLTSADGTDVRRLRGPRRRAERRRDRDHPGRPRPPSVLRGADAAVRRGRRARRGDRLLRPHRRRARSGPRASSTSRTSSSSIPRRSTATWPPPSTSCAPTRAARPSASTPSASASEVGSACSRRASGLDLSGRHRLLPVAGRTASQRPARPRRRGTALRMPGAHDLRRGRCGHPGRGARGVRPRARGGRRGAPHDRLRGRAALVLRSQVASSPRPAPPPGTRSCASWASRPSVQDARTPAAASGRDGRRSATSARQAPAAVCSGRRHGRSRGRTGRVYRYSTTTT